MSWFNLFFSTFRHSVGLYAHICRGEWLARYMGQNAIKVVSGALKRAE
ncbi:hypothetical protein [Amphritea sp.]